MRPTTSKIIKSLILASWITAGFLTASCGGGSHGSGNDGGGGFIPPPPTEKVVALRADVVVENPSPGQLAAPSWGIAIDSSFNALDGIVTVGNTLFTVPYNLETLIIHMDNNLPEPTSMVINGQESELAPVRNPDGRVRSFTHETPPGNTSSVDYTFTNLKPGTYLLESGTHPAVQVQMGLYAVMVKDYAPNEAYPGVPYDSSTVLIYGELDSNLHTAVATGNYGPGKAVTSTIDFHPQVLLNGNPIPDGVQLPVMNSGQRLLIRFANAGIATHAPLINGAYLDVVAEDGHALPYPRRVYSILLPAGKTLDAILTYPPSGSVTLVPDRLIFHM